MSYVSIEHASKHFGATAALSEVSFSVGRGEIHGLLGENGAGKSTLMKILSGMLVPDDGRVRIDGHELKLGHPDAARRAGLSMAYQELSSPPNVTVATKLALPHLPRGRTGMVSSRAVRAAGAAKLLKWEMTSIDPDARISDLNLADRQHVELVNAMSKNPKLLILDEPTAALPDPDWLFRQLRKMAANDTSVIYISHKFAEIEELCDHQTVLRNGRVVGSFSRGEANERELIQLMIGRSLNQVFPAKRDASKIDEPLLDIKNLVVPPRLKGVDLTVHPGEVVGVAGLEGQGQSELFYSLAGLLPRRSGEINLSSKGSSGDRRPVTNRSQPDFVLVPEERKTEGLFMAMPSLFNLTISHLDRFRRLFYIDRKREFAFAEKSAIEVNLPNSLLSKPVAAVSGGNQQKIVFGRALLRRPQCLLLFDPTRGVDAATKMEIYHMTRRYANEGGGVLVYSTEIPELVGLCDRVYSIYKGRVQTVHEGDQLNEESIMRAALGHKDAVRSQ